MNQDIHLWSQIGKMRLHDVSLKESFLYHLAGQSLRFWGIKENPNKTQRPVKFAVQTLGIWMWTRLWAVRLLKILGIFWLMLKEVRNTGENTIQSQWFRSKKRNTQKSCSWAQTSLWPWPVLVTTKSRLKTSLNMPRQERENKKESSVKEISRCSLQNQWVRTNLWDQSIKPWAKTLF